MSELLDFDRNHIWHPYTSATNPIPTELVKGASGVRLKLGSGKALIDGMASWWCAIHGYSHPTLNDAAKDQIDRMAHVMFGGLTHEPAIKLCQTLVEITPQALQHVFLADSGSISVEVAIKMAIQYWHAQDLEQKHKLLSLRGGYHGDTFAAMSVCDPDTGMHHLFSGSVTRQVFTERPHCKFHENFDPLSLQNLEQILEREHHQLAAFILEPIVQGAGGMWFYHPEFLKQVRVLCNRYNVLLIADEIATGFGRTGKLFACEWADISPDILCLGKALTGGYMTLAATLTTKTIAEGISANGGVFMHGPTFMGNPLACAVANASVNLLLEQDWKSQVERIESTLTTALAAAKKAKHVIDVRVLGAIGVIEMEDAVDTLAAQEFFVQRGVWVRPFGRLVYVMPPYVISDEDLTTICQAMVDFVSI